MEAPTIDEILEKANEDFRKRRYGQLPEGVSGLVENYHAASAAERERIAGLFLRIGMNERMNDPEEGAGQWERPANGKDDAMRDSEKEAIFLAIYDSDEAHGRITDPEASAEFSQLRAEAVAAALPLEANKIVQEKVLLGPYTPYLSGERYETFQRMVRTRQHCLKGIPDYGRLTVFGPVAELFEPGKALGRDPKLAYEVLQSLCAADAPMGSSFHDEMEELGLWARQMTAEVALRENEPYRAANSAGEVIRRLKNTPEDPMLERALGIIGRAHEQITLKFNVIVQRAGIKFSPGVNGKDGKWEIA